MASFKELDAMVDGMNLKKQMMKLQDEKGVLSKEFSTLRIRKR
jgi:hypothetical protein